MNTPKNRNESPRFATLFSALIGVALLGGACGQRPETAFSDLDQTSPGYTRKASASNGQDIALGAFNVLRLGQGEKNIKRLAAVIDKAKYDVFAAVEIMKPEAADELLQALRTKTGRDWRLALSPSASGEGAYKEYNGFFYRAEAVKAEMPSAAYCRSNLGTENTGSTCFARDDDGKFERDPFVGHFKVHGVSVALISVHLIYGETVKGRKDEAMVLRDVMDDVQKKTPGANVFLMGDFNLTVSSDDDAPEPLFTRYTLESMPKEVFSKGPLVNGLFDGITTLGSSSYDHILVYENMNGKLVPGTDKVVSDINEDNAAQRALFKAEVSDHYAVAARFKFH